MSKFFVLRVDAADPDDEHTVYLDGRPHIVSSARQVANDFASRPIPGARTLKEALAAARRMRARRSP